MSTADKIAHLREMREAALLGGGAERIAAAACAREADRARARRAAARRRDASSSSTRSSRIAPPTSGSTSSGTWATAWSPATAPIDGRLVFVYARTSPSSAARCRRRTPRRSARSWTWRMENGAPIIGLTDSGGARIQEGVVSPRRLRRHLPAQHARLRRRAADLADPGAVRRRRRLLAGDHRLHGHGRGHELHVRDRPERGEDGDARGGRPRGSRRRARPQRDERRRALPAPGEPQALRAGAAADRLPAAEQRRAGTAARADGTIRRSARRGARRR